MTNQKDRDVVFARKGRAAALVIASAGLGAILAPWIVAVTGLPARFEMLIYFAALGAFVWALVVTYQLWRMRQEDDPPPR